jgi:acyl carrier protein
MTDFQGSIMSIVTTLLERSDKGEVAVALDTAIHGDGLGLDSLETAELSAMLEDEFGTDPFGAGLMPETVGEIVDFYTEGESVSA